MEALKFVDLHNMVAYLEKSTENANFDKIVDFLNANPIRYALTPQADVGEDETIHEERGDNMERAATTAASLDAKFLALENVKTAQDLEITNLKKRVKKLEMKKKGKNSTTQEEIIQKTQRRYDQDINVTIVSAPNTTVGVSVSTAEPSTPPTTTTFIEDKDLTIAQTLMKMRSEKSKEKAKERGSKEKSSEPATRPIRGVTIQEPSESGTRKAVPPLQHDLKDKGKAKMIKSEKPLKKKGYDQGELTIEERSRLFVELMDKRKKHFAKLKAEKIRRKPPTKEQKRNQMSTYLRNMAGYKYTKLKNKSFEEIHMLFDKEMKRVNSFVPMDSEVVEGSGKKTESSRKETVSKKRAGEELDEESVKRQKLEDDAEKAEL
ncbi:hypothetical protein Tco_1186566 [Tanacetum coccineum]